MHCVSSYPLEFKNCNFKKLDYLKKFSNKVGYSGHYKGVSMMHYLQLKKKQLIIEKHFTIDNNLPGSR